MRAIGTIVTALAVLAIGVMPASAGVPPKIGKAELHGVAPSDDASGHAVIELHPFDAKVQMDHLRGLPGRPARAFVVWLATGRSRGYVAGGFRGSWAPHGFEMTVPGRKSISYRNARRGDRIVVTAPGKYQATGIFVEAGQAGWKPRLEIKGARVMRGRIARPGP